MLIRTVLDCRTGDPKFYAAICLLVESWSQTLRGRHALQILALGHVPPALRSYFAARGAKLLDSKPDPDLSFVPTGNTLLGAAPTEGAQRILLVDNDTVFLRPLDDLEAVPRAKLGGAISGSDRISVANWREIETALHLPTLPGGQVLDKSRLSRMRNPAAALDRFPRGYINGGVLLLPQDPEFAGAWKSHIIRIKQHFEGNTDQHAALCRSNMAGLATAAATFGGVYWLDDGLNYRHYHFLLNARPLDRIFILHMTGFPRADWPSNGDDGVSAYVESYWRSRIVDPLAKLRPHMPGADWQGALDTSKTVLKHLLSLVRGANLDAVFAAA